MSSIYLLILFDNVKHLPQGLKLFLERILLLFWLSVGINILVGVGKIVRLCRP